MSLRGGRPHFLAEAVTWPGTFGLGIGDGARVLARTVTVAGDSAARRRGLLARAQLASDEGLIVAPTFGVHTFGMGFAIDVAFVDRSGRVLAIAAGVPPRRIKVRWGAFAAVELAAGRCRDAALEVGDRLLAVRPGRGPMSLESQDHGG